MPNLSARMTTAPEFVPAATLATALLESYNVPAKPGSKAFNLAQAAFETFLRGATCVEVEASSLVDVPDCLLAIDKPSTTKKPLVVRNGKLYLARLDHLEALLAQQILERLKPRNADVTPQAHWLPQPKPDSTFTAADQREAVKLAVQAPFAVLTGGPGTGKTTTASCIIGATLETYKIKPEDVRLCAPTGRAASQLHGGLIEDDKALVKNAKHLGCQSNEELRQRLPKAYTIHKFIRNPDMMEGAKLVVVDECSMIDLGLFHDLLRLIPKDARIVLIGDPQQLPSVDTGSVFRDLCGQGCLASYLVTLKEPIRAQGQAKTWYDFVVEYKDRTRTPHPAEGLVKASADNVMAACIEAFKAIVKLAHEECYTNPAVTPSAKALLMLSQTIKSIRVLCAFHRGPLGVRKLNEAIRNALNLEGSESPGALIMITRNDHDVTDLSNGDVGLVVKGGRVWFPGKTVAIPFNQLPPHTPAFATTIHKSQGSEYGKVLLVLPQPEDEPNEEAEPFINKQLVFTGITRARDTIALFTTSDILYTALGKSADRASGLAERLGK